MKQYWLYFKYVINHKKNVGIEAFKMGMPVHALMHDISKFMPSEFIPYANYFYKEFAFEYERTFAKKAFDVAWLRHQNRNAHHWDHWVDAEGTAFEMPMQYVREMVADWKGMARKFGDTAWEYFHSNEKTMNLHPNTIIKIEGLLKP